MMRRISKNAALWITVAAILAFGIGAILLSVHNMIEVANGLVLGGSFAVMLTWFPAARRSVADGSGSGASLLQMAVFGVGAGLFCHRLYVYAVRWLGRPDWLLESDIAPAAPWALFVAIVMILLAPGTQEGNIPLRNYVWFVFAGVLGALVSGVAIGASLVKIAE